MFTQPYQNGGAILNAVMRLCLFVGELAFFNLFDQRQFKSQQVIELCSFHTLSHQKLHLFGKEGVNHIQDVTQV